MPKGKKLGIDGEEGKPRSPPWRPAQEEERGIRPLCQTVLESNPSSATGASCLVSLNHSVLLVNVK